MPRFGTIVPATGLRIASRDLGLAQGQRAHERGPGGSHPSEYLWGAGRCLPVSAGRKRAGDGKQERVESRLYGHWDRPRLRPAGDRG
jgi:hypothetical protein